MTFSVAGLSLHNASFKFLHRLANFRLILKRRIPRNPFVHKRVIYHQGYDGWGLKWRRCLKAFSFNRIEVFWVIDSHFLLSFFPFLSIFHLSILEAPIVRWRSKERKNAKFAETMKRARKDISKHKCESSENEACWNIKKAKDRNISV